MSDEPPFTARFSLGRNKGPKILLAEPRKGQVCSLARRRGVDAALESAPTRQRAGSRTAWSEKRADVRRRARRGPAGNDSRGSERDLGPTHDRDGR